MFIETESLKKKRNNSWTQWKYLQICVCACVCMHNAHTHILLWGKKLLAFIWFSQSSMTQKILIIPKLNGYTPLWETYLCVNLNPVPFHPLSASACAHPSAWNTFLLIQSINPTHSSRFGISGMFSVKPSLLHPSSGGMNILLGAYITFYQNFYDSIYQSIIMWTCVSPGQNPVLLICGL